jgi:hypothetical protein
LAIAARLFPLQQSVGGDLAISWCWDHQAWGWQQQMLCHCCYSPSHKPCPGGWRLAATQPAGTILPATAAGGGNGGGGGGGGGCVCGCGGGGSAVCLCFHSTQKQQRQQVVVEEEDEEVVVAIAIHGA